MNPFERWKHSPPEKEAPLDLIKQAAATTSYGSEQSGVASKTHSQTGRTQFSSGGSWQVSSASSIEQNRTSSKASTVGSGSSYSYGSRQSLGSLTSKGRRRRRAMPKTKTKSSNKDPSKIFQCTFCTDTFHIKYDWTRHEKSLHLSLEKWICGPLGPVITLDANGTTSCVYCGDTNPSASHLDTHAHYECEHKKPELRTFYRKDHLRQHLRLVHRVEFTPSMEQWKSCPPIVRSRCGFCPADKPTTFTAWQERADHLAKHFREGARMSQWKGGHGFDAEVAAQVTNAMPPYLIEHERGTPNPFSASGGDRGLYGLFDRPSSGDIFHDDTDISCDARKVSTCWEVLTKGLGCYVQNQRQLGLLPCDKDLQRQARILLYGEDDDWNQTSADNAEWLRLFKQAHGLDVAGTTSAPVPSPTDEMPSTMDFLTGGAYVSIGDQNQNCPLQLEHFGQDEEMMRMFEQAGIYGDEPLGDMGPSHGVANDVDGIFNFE